MDIEEMFRMLASGEISPEDAAKFFIRWIYRHLRRQGLSRKEVIEFGTGLAGEALDATKKYLEECKRGDGERDGRDKNQTSDSRGCPGHPSN